MRLKKLIAGHLYLEAESVTLWTTDCGNAALVSVAHLKSAELTAYHQAELKVYFQSWIYAFIQRPLSLSILMAHLHHGLF